MSQDTHAKRWIRSALFVDFDNIYTSLNKLDSRAAKTFASDPERWLTWFREQVATDHLGVEHGERHLLIRKCYLNPQSYAEFRPFFIRSAFEVIDCPPLTREGKTSTDIHLVIDVLDALSHPTHFDEFVLLSADADFTPLLLRLRMHDRRSTLLSIGYVSPAYKSACDYMISREDFLHDALGLDWDEEPIRRPMEEPEVDSALAGLLSRMAQRLRTAVISEKGLQAYELPLIYKEFAEFRDSKHWLGFFSLRSLTEKLVAQRSDLRIVEDDPWWVMLEDGPTALPNNAAPPALQKPKPAPQASALPQDAGAAKAAALPETADAALMAAISEVVREEVTRSPDAVPMARLAGVVRQRFAEQIANSNWLRAGTFKGLLSRLNLGALAISPAGPSYVYDPDRHREPVDRWGGLGQRAERFNIQYPDLAPLAQKVHLLTDTPYLLPEDYGLLLHELAREINESGFQLGQTSKTVRDRCVERGAPIARSVVNFVIIGISYTGYRLGENGKESAGRLGEALVQNTLNLCRTAQLALAEQEEAQIREWIVGALPDEAAAEVVAK